jgi:hypothetical protein
MRLVSLLAALVACTLPAAAFAGSVYPPPDVDTNPPTAVITKGPEGKISSSKATFRFTADEVGSSFECRLDGKAYLPCTSPAKVSGLRSGKHTFRVRATDQAGNVGSAAKRQFRVAKKNR